MSYFSKPARYIFMEIQKIDGNYYPETLNKLFIINAGSGFKMLWKAVKAFLSKRTLAKIHKLIMQDAISDAAVITTGSFKLAMRADILLVKPGLPYLDIIRLLRDSSPLPIAAYQFSPLPNARPVIPLPMPDQRIGKNSFRPLPPASPHALLQILPHLNPGPNASTQQPTVGYFNLILMAQGVISLANQAPAEITKSIDFIGLEFDPNILKVPHEAVRMKSWQFRPTRMKMHVHYVENLLTCFTVMKRRTGCAEELYTLKRLMK